MNMKIKVVTTCLLLIISQLVLAQMKDYNYKRRLNIKENKWYSIPLPDDVYGKIAPDFQDIRIFGITNKKDTIEAPYFIKVLDEMITQNNIRFELLNESKNKNGYYFTFKVPVEATINQLKLNFKQQNFDWHLLLEGSEDQEQWFSIVEDYRILSVKNGATDFKFTTVNFPLSNYKYYRIRIKADTKPELLDATLSIYEIESVASRNYLFSSDQIKKEEEGKETTLTVSLPTTIPVADLKICVSDKFDYYRMISISEPDSARTLKGLHYFSTQLASGTLSSLDKNIFKLYDPVLKKIQITIYNQDDQPLHIDSIIVRSHVHELRTRITIPANYFLVYGNKYASKPDYDLSRFTFTMPKEFTCLVLGPETVIEKPHIQKIRPLFENKIWLWTLMVILIIILGVFSFKMMKKSNG
jgi:hypothetical protein